jgi:CHASE2 domain-containing sensor protein
MRVRDARRLTRAVSVAAGCLLPISVGLACLQYSFARPVTRASYDLPFLWRQTLETNEIVLLYLDEASAKQLNQPLDDVWNRTLHIPLLERLKQDGARLAFYDIVFDTSSPDAKKDADFAAALRDYGRAVLGGALEIVQPMRGVQQERILPPLKLLRQSAGSLPACWAGLSMGRASSTLAIRATVLPVMRVLLVRLVFI